MAVEDGGPLLKTVKANLSAARSHTATWRNDAREDFDFVAGHQWDSADEAKLKEQIRPIITFNRVGPVIDAIVGSEISNRQTAQYLPREEGDAGVSAVATGAAEWARDCCDAEDEETDAYMDAVISGIGCTETRMDYEIDGDGMILIERIDPLEMFWDPGAKKKNLSDARWVARLKFMTKEDIKAMWPDDAEEALEAADPWGTLAQEVEGEQPHQTDGEDGYAKSDPDIGAETYKGKVRVVEYQYWERKKVYRVADPTTGQVLDLAEKEFKKLDRATKKAGVPLDYAPQTRRVYKRCFFVGDVIVEKGDNPDPKGFTFKFITAKRDRNANTWYGIVRCMKDPQRWANKWLSQALHIFNSQAKGGIIAEENAFSDMQKAESTWAMPDAITWAAPGAVERKMIQPKPVADYPSSMDKLMNFAVSSIRDVTGVNLEMLGLADRQQAGILEQHRKQAGLTILASLFDSLRRYRKEQGRLLLHFIREYIADGRLIRVLGANARPEYVKLFKQQLAPSYDIIVDEAPTSPNQKERTFAVLQSLLPAIKEIIPPKLWTEIIKVSPLPNAFTEKAVAIIEEQMNTPPPPDPKMELEQAKLQKDIEGRQIDNQGKMIDLEIRKIEANAALQEVEAKTRADMMKAQTDAQKLMLQAENQQMKAEADRASINAKMEADRQKAMLDEFKMHNQMVAETVKAEASKSETASKASGDGMAKGLEAMGKAIGSGIEQAFAAFGEQVAAAISAEKEIIYGDDGRPRGARTKRQTLN